MFSLLNKVSATCNWHWDACLQNVMRRAKFVFQYFLKSAHQHQQSMKMLTEKAAFYILWKYCENYREISLTHIMVAYYLRPGTWWSVEHLHSRHKLWINRFHKIKLFFAKYFINLARMTCSFLFPLRSLPAPLRSPLYIKYRLFRNSFFAKTIFWAKWCSFCFRTKTFGNLKVPSA